MTSKTAEQLPSTCVDVKETCVYRSTGYNQHQMLLTQLVCGFLLLANAGSTAETTIAVFPKEQFEKSKLAKPIAEALVSKLQRPGWKVLDGTSAGKGTSLLKPVADVIEDELAIRAATLNADIMIVFEGELIKRRGETGFMFALSAYETITARNLASETTGVKTGSDDPIALAKAACDQVVPAAIKQMQDYLKFDAKTGRRYRIVLYNPPKNADMYMVTILRKICRHVKTRRRDDQLHFYSQCKTPRNEIIGEIKKAIRKKLRRKKYTIYPSPRQLIVIDFK